MRRVAIDAQRAVAEACSTVLSVLPHAAAHADLGYDSVRLHTLVDGLAFHALTADRKELRPKAILAVLRATSPSCKLDGLILGGHWRQQACGRVRARRKPMWIAPDIKGPGCAANADFRVADSGQSLAAGAGG